MILILIFSAIALFFSLLVTGGLKQQFQKTLLDIPNDRSSHSQPTPRGGGLGFILAFFLSLAIAQIFVVENSGNLTLVELGQLGAVLIPLAAVGFIDDRHDLPAKVRYLVQAGSASLGIYWFGVLSLWPHGSGGWAGYGLIPLTVIGFTVLINFYNFMDGLDGLVAGVAAVQFAFFALALGQTWWWFLVAALLGFLYWNWSPAKIFMGDVGSTVLGAALAIALVIPTDPSTFWQSLPITLPIIGDAIYTLIRRLQRRENIFQAHRSHLYQRLQQSGWSHGRVALTYVVLTLIIGIGIYQWEWLGSILGVMLTLGAIAWGEKYLQSRPSS